TVGAAGGGNTTTVNGALTQSGGVASLNASSNFATNINTGSSTGNVTIGNGTALGTNSVSILAGSAGTIGLTGTTNINTGAGNGATSIGNSSNTLTGNASSATLTTVGSYAGNIGTTWGVTAGTSTTLSSPVNSLLGQTNNIGTTQTAGGVNNIGVNAISTNTISGLTDNIHGATINIGALGLNPSNAVNIGSVAGNTTTTISGLTANMSATTNNITGTANINTSGAATTTIGATTNSLVINAPTTHNGITTFNNVVNHGANADNGSNFQITGGAINGTPIGAVTPSTGSFTTLMSNTAGDVFSGNSAGTSILTLTNSTATGNALNVTNGIGTFGTSGAPDGVRVVINGQVSPTPVLAGQYELVVNGDAQVTGTLSAGNLTSTGTIGAPTGAFDNLTTFTAANSSINVNRGLNLNGIAGQNNLAVGGNATVTGTTALTGLLSANGGITTNNANINAGAGSITGGAISGTTGTFSGLLTANNGFTVSGGTITFSPLGTGVLHSTSGTISSSLVNLTSDVTGILPIANGGTNSNAAPTLGGIAYGNGTQYQFTAAGTSGQVLTSNGAAAPTWQNLPVLPAPTPANAELSVNSTATAFVTRNNLLNDGTTVTVTGPFVAQGTNTLSGTTTISGNTTLSGGVTSVSSPTVSFNSGFISGGDPINMTGPGNSFSG